MTRHAFEDSGRLTVNHFDLRKLSVWASALAVPAFAGWAGCTQESTAVAPPREFGAVGFKLSLPGGIDIPKVVYTITRGGNVAKSNEVVIAGPGTTFAAKIEQIPIGSDYTIKLDSKGASFQCAGSATFDIKPKETTTVSVRLRCPGKPKESGAHGSLWVEGDINVCPVIDNAIASPNGDGTYGLSASGSDYDEGPSALMYKWTASAGTLSGADSANALLKCPGSGGDVTVMLELSDSDTGCHDVAGVTETLMAVDCSGGGSGPGGSSGDGGAGSGATGGGGAGGDDAAPDGASAECIACRDQNCRDYQGSGLDMVAGCFTKVDPSLGADAGDASFLQDCLDFVDCAQANQCAYDVNGASDCYCGSATPDDCINIGPAADAKCVSETQKAARSTANADVTLRFSDLAYPIGWAYFLLECDSVFCDACKPE